MLVSAKESILPSNEVTDTQLPWSTIYCVIPAITNCSVVMRGILLENRDLKAEV